MAAVAVVVGGVKVGSTGLNEVKGEEEKARGSVGDGKKEEKDGGGKEEGEKVQSLPIAITSMQKRTHQTSNTSNVSVVNHPSLPTSSPNYPHSSPSSHSPPPSAAPPRSPSLPAN